jgi:glycosyltransferase involved in cell wall biosynthesis
MTRTGWRYHLLRLTEKLACAAATNVYCVSPSVRDVVIQLGICAADKVSVLGNGSVSGIDLHRFRPAGDPDRRRTRRRFGMPENCLVAGFVGRLVRDKGIAELLLAWQDLRQEFPNLHLLCCGEFEPQDPVPEDIRLRLRRDPRVHLTDSFVSDMPAVYAALDVCLLPTYREGLPQVALECAAMEIPMVASRVPGCVDAIQDGITGLLVEPRSPGELAEAAARLLRSADLRARMGKAGRKFVAERFSEQQVLNLLLQEYRRLLSNHEPSAAREPEEALESKS